jgi:hypothetical protein
VADVEHADEAVDPDATPFAAPPTEGIPYEKGSEEERAIERILERARQRDTQASTPR